MSWRDLGLWVVFDHDGETLWWSHRVRVGDRVVEVQRWDELCDDARS